MKKEPKFPAPFFDSGLFCVFDFSVFNDSFCFFSSSGFVEFLSGSNDIVDVFLYTVNRFHDAILSAETSCSHLGVEILCFSAGENLETYGTKYSTTNK